MTHLAEHTSKPLPEYAVGVGTLAQALPALSRALLEERNPAGVCERICATLQNAGGYDGAAITRFDPAVPGMTLWAVSGRLPMPWEPLATLGTGAAHTTAVPGGCVATLSLDVAGERGCLIVHRREGPPFTPRELDLLMHVADTGHLALRGLQVEARIRERTTELEAANAWLSSASQHKSAFLASMSHEIRTPLNSILGFTELLLGQLKETASASHLRYLTNVQRSGHHLLRLLNDILDISRVEAGRVQLDPQRIQVMELLEDIRVVGRGLATRKLQDVQLEAPEPLPAIDADPVRFKQIFFNLLSNAVKFSPQRSTVTITARRATDAGQTWVEIAVTDQGVGLRPDEMPLLFREFSQLASAGAARYEGSGLGLALTKRLVELHGGTIAARSSGEGKGSTFTVRFPVGEETQPLEGAKG